MLSLVLCSRNDRYQGNSLWRLETALNYAARVAAAAGQLDQLEIIVSDWGSETPLREAVSLTDQAAHIVRFLTVRPEIARAEQGESPFPEVLALNAAVRRARGEYIGRIDQDTLISPHFLERFSWLTEERRLLVPLEEAVLVSNRRSIPYRLAVILPPLALLDGLVRNFGRLLPRHDPPPAHEFYHCAIGILLMHRDLWNVCRGYDERFVYMDHSEIEMMLRLSTRYGVVDLGPIVDCAFFHLNHGRPRVSREVNQEMRTRNPLRTVNDMPEEFAPNGPEWGLATYDMELLPVSAAREARRPWWTVAWPVLAVLLVVAAGQTVFDSLYPATRRRVREAVVRLGLYPVVARLRKLVV